MSKEAPSQSLWLCVAYVDFLAHQHLGHISIRHALHTGASVGLKIGLLLM